MKALPSLGFIRLGFLSKWFAARHDFSKSLQYIYFFQKGPNRFFFCRLEIKKGPSQEISFLEGFLYPAGVHVSTGMITQDNVKKIYSDMSVHSVSAPVPVGFWCCYITRCHPCHHSPWPDVKILKLAQMTPGWATMLSIGELPSPTSCGRSININVWNWNWLFLMLKQLCKCNCPVLHLNMFSFCVQADSDYYTHSQFRAKPVLGSMYNLFLVAVWAHISALRLVDFDPFFSCHIRQSVIEALEIVVSPNHMGRMDVTPIAIKNILIS